MRALDCVHEAHEDMQLTAETDEDLVEQALRHRDEFHPEMTDEQIRELVAANAYDKAAA
jgi:hypothetical protein